MAGNEVRFRTTVDDKASGTFKSLDKQLDSTGIKSKGLTGQLNALGSKTGLGGSISPASLATAGIFALGGVLLDSAKKAATEETGILRLTQSLRANVPAWDGNTEAIEQRIRAGEDLAFSDGDLRDSLALLVATTHDVNKAFDIQQTAMDLARFKGISLQDATEALTKVEAGSYRILKSLGIVLKDGATQTEALAAVQKVAGGQAIEFAESSAGAFAKTQIALDDLQETLGKFVLPKMKELSDVIRLVTRNADDLIGKLRQVNPALGDMADKAQDVLNPFALIGDAWEVLARKNFDLAIKSITGELGRFEDQSIDTVEALRGSSGLADALGITANHALDTSEKIKSLAFGTLTALQTGVRNTTGFVTERFYGMAHGVEVAMQLTKKSVKDDINGLAQYTEDRLSTKALNDILLGKGSLGAKLQRGLNSHLPDVRQAAIKIRDELQDILDARLGVTVTVEKEHHGAEKRASGGPVKRGEPYIVGEHRPELFIPDQSGTILPSVPGGGVTVNVSFSSFVPYTAAQMQQVARALTPELTRELRNQHII